MPRLERIDIGDVVYHVINRANARAQIFDEDADYFLFGYSGFPVGNHLEI